MRLTRRNLSLLIILFAGCGSKTSGNNKQKPPDSAIGLNLDNVQISELATIDNKPDAVNSIDTQGNLQNTRAFRFEVKQISDFSFAQKSVSFGGCSDDPGLELLLTPMKTFTTLSETALLNLKETTQTKLEPGSYSVIVKMNPKVLCDSIKVSFAVSLKTATQKNGPDDKGDANPPVPQRIVDIEQDRILQRQLKSDTRFEFLAHTSVSAGCEPVFARTPEELKNDDGAPENSTSLVKVDFADVGDIEHSVILSRTPETAQEVQLAALTGKLTVLKFDLLKQPKYANDWKSAFDELLLKNGGKIQLALDSQCAKNGVLLVSHFYPPASFPKSFEGVSSNDNSFPLTVTKDANGLATPDLNFKYSYNDPSTSSLLISMKLDIVKILEKVGSLSNVADVRWMLGNRKDSFPLSEWTIIPTSEFFTSSGKTTLILNHASLANRALFRFFEKSFVLNIRFNSEHKGERAATFVIDAGYFCPLSYTRPDGSAFHNKLFTDLTHPDWNASPDRDAHKGCAFVGEKWWP